MDQNAKELSLIEQCRYTGSTDQLYSVRRLMLQEGPGDGVRLIEVCTAAGMRAVFCESRALDLYELHFRGINLGFLSKNGLIGGRVPAMANEFTPSWPAGFLATCGLRNTGPSCEMNGEFHPLHGRIGGMPAELVSVDLNRDANQLIIKGQMRESALFGHHLILKREIRIPLDGSAIDWQDTVLNLAAEAEPVFLLYHFNFGYPFLSPDLQLHFPPGEVLPRTEVARQGLAEFDQICAPEDGYQEQVFFHQAIAAESAVSTVSLRHPRLGLSANLTFNRTELPVLVQWKSMKSGDYALGIEPSTSQIRGRAEEMAAGYDQVLPGFGRKNFHIHLELA